VSPEASGWGATGWDAADWASRTAERLPPGDVRALARAAAEGPDAVRRLRAQTPAPVLRDACDQLLSGLARSEPGYLAGLLTGATRAIERARQHQSLGVVWTGPESGINTGRLTAATVIDLIAEARREILLISYATRTEPAISAALSAAAGRGVEITLLVERHADNPAYVSVETPFRGLDAIRLHWPHGQRLLGASLHAKVIVVDDRIALVGSANLTSRAMETNLECGILVRGGPQPRAIRGHITELRASGELRRLG
jgi:phosphatidylserine/phosphatidylglycerophosphate/cardiolipin synthase-like enzyme